MFDIDYLITPYIQNLLDESTETAAQAKILIQLLNFRKYYSNDAANIAAQWADKAETVYNMEIYSNIFSDKQFIKDYADSTQSLKKTKKLINDLCIDLEENNGNNYRDIIAKAENDFSAIQDLSDADFTFLPILNGQVQKADDHRRSLDEILKYKDLVKK